MQGSFIAMATSMKENYKKVGNMAMANLYGRMDPPTKDSTNWMKSMAEALSKFQEKSSLIKNLSMEKSKRKFRVSLMIKTQKCHQNGSDATTQPINYSTILT